MNQLPGAKSPDSRIKNATFRYAAIPMALSAILTAALVIVGFAIVWRYFAEDSVDPVAQELGPILLIFAAALLCLGLFNGWATVKWKSKPLLALAINLFAIFAVVIGVKYIENVANNLPDTIQTVSSPFK